MKIHAVLKDQTSLIHYEYTFYLKRQNALSCNLTSTGTNTVVNDIENTNAQKGTPASDTDNCFQTVTFGVEIDKQCFSSCLSFENDFA